MMKTYIKPTMQVVEVESNQQILAGLTASVKTTGLEEKLTKDSTPIDSWENAMTRRQTLWEKDEWNDEEE
jgi:hypothetical protein